jgi:hypothetical protein
MDRNRQEGSTMADDREMHLRVPEWLERMLGEESRRLGVPIEGLARSILEAGVLGIGRGSPAPTPAPPTIHHPPPSNTPPSPAPPTIHHPYAPPTPAPPTIHHPPPSNTPPSPAPPTIHHPASGRIVGWRELSLDHRLSCAECGRDIAAGSPAQVAMDDTGVFRTTICPSCFAKRTRY